MLRLFRRYACLVLLALLAGCSGSGGPAIPVGKSEYIGRWQGAAQGTTMILEISRDGQVRYARNGKVNKSLDAPLQHFADDDFVVGVGPLNTRFRVSAPPHEVRGEWRMTVDGVELTRQQTATEI